MYCSQNTTLKTKESEKNSCSNKELIWSTVSSLHGFWSFVTLQSFYPLNSCMSRTISHLPSSLLPRACLVFVERFILWFIIFNVTVEISTSVTLCSLICKPFNKAIILLLSLSKCKKWMRSRLRVAVWSTQIVSNAFQVSSPEFCCSVIQECSTSLHAVNVWGTKLLCYVWSTHSLRHWWGKLCT